MRLSLLLILFSSYVHGQTLMDTRDGQVYKYKRLENLYWMTENLQFEAEGSICLADCENIRFYDFQYLEGVCPEGWRLPTMDEWDLFTNSMKGAEVARMMEDNEKLYRIDFLDKYNLFENNSLGIKPYGRIEGGELKKGPFIDYWTTNEAIDDRFHMHLTPYSITGHSHKHHLKTKKPEEFRLFPIRCVCEANKINN